MVSQFQDQMQWIPTTQIPAIRSFSYKIPFFLLIAQSFLAGLDFDAFQCEKMHAQHFLDLQDSKGLCM
jgi:hypothetical protein